MSFLTLGSRSSLVTASLTGQLPPASGHGYFGGTMAHAAARLGTTALRAGAIGVATALVLAACTGDNDTESDDAASQGSDPASVVTPGTASSSHVDNAYAGATMYVNDKWSAQVEETADAAEGDDGDLADAMRDIADTPTAVWMDRISAIDGNADGPGLRYHLDAALEQADGDEQMILTVVIYDLPGRDCFALASNGELPATDEGLARYESDYIDPIAQMLAEDKYASLRVAAIIEPDSLPNLVTNDSDPKCQAADPYYRDGVAYALDSFAPLDNVYTYIDAAHSGWLGWDTNSGPTAQLFAEVVKSTEAGFDSVDGFVTNTANFTPLEEPYLTDPEQQVGGQPVKSGAFYEYNPDFDEADWTADLYTRLVGEGFPESIGMLVDTSRNGWGGEDRPTSAGSGSTVDAFVDESKIDARTHRGAWCNQDGAGLGRLPQALPDGYEASHLDAFVWVKPPGESDGGSSEIDNDEGKGFDPMCDPGFSTERLAGNTTNALADAPLAGKWFAAQFAQLVANAYPEVGAEVPAPRTDADANKPVGAETESSEQAQEDGSTGDDSAAAEGDESAGDSAAGCTAQLTVVNKWGTGFEARVKVKATGPITGWVVTMSLPKGSAVNNIWNGDNSGKTGTFTVGDAGWNGALAKGGTGEFGFVGDGVAPEPSSLECSAS
ncbi:glycoside hydrolase family 6 protein [Demequina aurantiaca]|uniref:glycoside hydrolase family 6 protein n=1 Tax=Demequina aurantiaca TaxID=676200 RepID=UPI003D348502